MIGNNTNKSHYTGQPVGLRLLYAFLILVMVFTSLTTTTVAPVQAVAINTVKAAPTVTTLHLSVISAVAPGAAIPNFKFIINIDNTGTTTQRSPAVGSGCSPQDAGYPGSCDWVSVAGRANNSPIYASGTQDDFPGGVLSIGVNPVNLPPGRYLISVLADGYKLDGEHFTVPSDTGNVVVKMQPYDLPDATVQAAVFEDMTPTNSAPDLPAERGLAGFRAHIKDYIDEVTTDVYGAPLCGNGICLSKCYVVDGGLDIGTVAPVDAAGRCPFDITGLTNTLEGPAIPATAVIEGKVIIPNLGPNRYALSVTPPNNSGWLQTTTLEGNHDWDAWVMEGATGLDTEFVVAGEPFPATFFGYVKAPTNSMAGGSGTVKGKALAVSAYIPPVGGITGEIGLLGAKAKAKNPIKRLLVSLSDINNGDQTVFVGEFDCIQPTCAPVDFSIPNVPDGDYVLGIWDEPQDYIFNFQNVSVRNGETIDLGSISLMGWWTTIEGYVFNDLNENGKKDAGEPGIPNFPIVMRTRENSIMDRGTTAVNTDGNGYYWMESAYPMTQWLVEEAYADGFQTTGITYQADNQNTETTVLGQGVDINVHPVIGLGGRLDWGVKAYAPGTNGGIVGTISYDTTRNELDPSYAAIEDWQPSISNLKVDLYEPVLCGTTIPAAPCDENGFYELAADGSYKLGKLLNTYLSESWERPTNCVARNVDGNALVHGTDENVLPLNADAPCLEAPMMGVQFAPMEADQGTADANFGASVDGNYGFGDACYNGTLNDADPTAPVCTGGAFTSLIPNRDYIVKVNIPNDALGRPMYKVTREEDINIANGDSFVPQATPPACVGALHTVDVAGFGADGPNATQNPTFVDIGGSPYEGQVKPLCDMKLVPVQDRRSIAPGFNLFTDVPLPGRFWGLIVDDLNFSSNPKSLAYGEKLGVPFAPVGIYDYTNRLITTVESDYNGLWDVLLPSTNRISCPTPSGVCANLYRAVGNDPGVPGRWNPNYTPQYRTISAEFETFPGLTIPADLAPTPVVAAVQIPGSQTLTPVTCDLDGATPQLFVASKPYILTSANAAARTITLTGLGFGATQGGGRVTLDNTVITPSAWSDRSITFTVPNNAAVGPRLLKITANNGQSTINGLTFHVIGGTYTPTVYEVGPGKTYATIQGAIEAASNTARALVVVYPAAADPTNPRYNGRGAYYENIVIHSPIKLQGVGPGGVYPDNTPVQGAIIDGIGYGGDTAMATSWRTLVGGLTWVGNPDVSEGQVIYVLPRTATQFTSGYPATIDGLDIRGGDQMGFPGNINAIFGGFPGPFAALNVETQGGAIYVNAAAHSLRITNNLIDSNSGSFGTVRFGTPNIGIPANNLKNDNIRVANNRIFANGGTNLAGAVALFNGTDNYEIASNDVCGNFSAEYGGGISHFGLSPNGSIHDNRIYYNHSYDEGAGIMIAGELPANPAANYGPPNGARGSGAVNIYNNLIQANMSEDDGGGIRFLMAGNFPMNVYNNMIVNNVSTHEGGGVALDDAPNVRFYNNTVMKNITTSTAITSDGQPAPAGLSTGANSIQLQNTLPVGSPVFSNPLLFNNIFWDNRAGARGINTVVGIGTTGDATPINHWDLGVMGSPAALLAPTNSIVQQNSGTYPYTTSPTNTVVDPAVSSPIDIPLTFTSWRTNVNFIGAIMVTAELPGNLLGNYHLTGTSSPAYNTGAASKAVPSYQQPPATLNAPSTDIDNQARPAFGSFDKGADEFPGLIADLFVTKTDGVTTVNPGDVLHYTIVISNAGPTGVLGATVNESASIYLTGATWNCTATAGSSCTANPNLTGSVSLLNGGSATYILNATVAANAVGGVSNTASVTVPAGTSDPVTGNNSATDTDVVNLPVPALGILDNFNRANANTLGANWSQATLFGLAAIRTNSNQAADVLVTGQAVWNVPAAGFGNLQGAAFTFTSTPANGTGLILKASGGTLPATFVRVVYTGSQLNVQTTTNGGLSYATRGAFLVSFATNDTLTAAANNNGDVLVWKTSGATTTFLGSVYIAPPGFWTGTGRVGLQMNAGSTVDNFAGGTVASLPNIGASFGTMAMPFSIFLPAVQQ